MNARPSILLSRFYHFRLETYLENRIATELRYNIVILHAEIYVVWHFGKETGRSETYKITGQPDRKVVSHWVPRAYNRCLGDTVRKGMK